MEEKKVMNDEQLEEVVGGHARPDHKAPQLIDNGNQNATLYNVIDDEMKQFIAAQNMTLEQFYALSDEKKQQLFAVRRENPYKCANVVFAGVHGMKEFQ